MAFVAIDVGMEMVRGLGAVVPRIEARDRSLADQVRRAASSVVLNIAEGAERRGKDRAHHFRIASGSAAELKVGLGIAEAWGYVPASALESTLARLQRLGGLIYGLQRVSP
jgi:four helix bundle protein